MLNVHLMESHSWLYKALVRGAQASQDYVLVPSLHDADIIIWPVPPWPDPAAPDHLISASPRELASIARRVYVFS